MSAFARHDGEHAFDGRDDPANRRRSTDSVRPPPRWEDEERVSAPQNEAEQVALWNLSALHERELVEPFDPRYADLVAEATARLTPRE